MNSNKDRPVVAICVNSAWNVANFRGGLVRGLVAAGYRVVVLAPDDHPREALAALGCELHPIAMDRGSVSPVHDLALLARLRRALAALRPAVVLGYTIKANVYAGLAAQSLGIPVINNIAGLGTMFLRGRGAALVARALYRIALARSRVVFFQNPDDQRLFLDTRLVRPRQARLLPGSGVDLDRFAVTPLPADEGAGPVSFVLIARLLRDKGVAEYVEAARQVRAKGHDARFVLVGGHDPGNAASIASALLAEATDSATIDYRGPVSDVRAAIAEADCVVLPSYREGLPRTLLEGAAMGRPLIATDVPGCRELVVEGANGFLCRAADVDSLATTMIAMIESGADARRAMAAASRRMAEQRFDERLVVEAYRCAIADVTAGGPAS